MICPRCRKSFFFLNAAGSLERGTCHRCHYTGKAEMPSYEGYHEVLYGRKKYTRTPQTDPQMRSILNSLRIQEKDHVAEFGCGVGDYLAEISRRTQNATGLDLDVSCAQKKYPGLSFKAHDFSRPVPFAGNSLDKVISINMIEHLPDWISFLKECRRVLKPGGLIAFSTANKSFFLHDFHYDATHLQEWTLAEFRQLLKPYFDEIYACKDCAMFHYYPLNQVVRFWLKPDLTFVGRKPLTEG